MLKGRAMQLDAKARETDSISLQNTLVTQAIQQSQVHKNASITQEEQDSAKFSKALQQNIASATPKETVAVLPQLNANAVVKTFDLEYAIKQYKAQMQSTKEIAYPTDTGYKINPQGYLTQEFNRIAGLPDGFKIHYETIKELDKAISTPSQANNVLNRAYARSNPNALNLSLNEMAGIFRSAWITFNAVTKEQLKEAHYFSESDLDKFPVGFATKYGTIHSDVTVIYQTQEAFDEAIEANESLVSGLDNGIVKLFNKEAFAVKEDSWNPHWEFYVNDKSQVSRSGLLVGFIKSHLFDSQTREVTRSLEYYNILSGKTSLREYILNNTEETLKDYYNFHNKIHQDTLTQEDREKLEADFDAWRGTFEGYDKVEDFPAFVASAQEAINRLQAIAHETYNTSHISKQETSATPAQGILEHIEAVTLQNDNLIANTEPVLYKQNKLNTNIGGILGVDINRIDALRDRAVQTYLLMQNINKEIPQTAVSFLA